MKHWIKPVFLKDFFYHKIKTLIRNFSKCVTSNKKIFGRWWYTRPGLIKWPTPLCSPGKWRRGSRLSDERRNFNFDDSWSVRGPVDYKLLCVSSFKSVLVNSDWDCSSRLSIVVFVLIIVYEEKNFLWY